MIEQIVFVDKNGQPTGEAGPKLEGHHSATKLHLAFSCYVFNSEGKFLVTQRALVKKVWPGVWTNSVCGHPAPGEDIVAAIQRRLSEELGMSAEDFKIVLPKYSYKTPPYKGIVEHEFCPVFVARATTEPIPNPEEIEDFAWVDWQEFVADVEQDSDDYSAYADPAADVSAIEGPKYSWWCKDQLKQLTSNETLLSYTKPTS